MKLRDLIQATLYIAKKPLTFLELKSRIELYLHQKYGSPHPNCRCRIEHFNKCRLCGSEGMALQGGLCYQCWIGENENPEHRVEDSQFEPIFRIEGTIDQSHKEGDVTIIDKFKVEGISLITKEEAEK